jgi:hypothetical protein
MKGEDVNWEDDSGAHSWRVGSTTNFAYGVKDIIHN